MKIDNLDGEFAFKALFKTNNGWELSDNFYLENLLPINKEVKWPVEIYDNGTIHIISKEELV